MDMDVEQASKMKRDLTRLDARLHDLRLFILRLSAIVALALIEVGLVLPAWSEEIDEKQVTARVLTAGFMALDEPFDVLPTAGIIGFLGLLLVVLLLCGVLVSSVIWGNGREGARLRNVIGTLAVIGSVIASLFSYVGWVSDESDVSGGWGPVVLLVGVIAAVVLLNHRPWQDLWIQQPERR